MPLLALFEWYFVVWVGVSVASLVIGLTWEVIAPNGRLT
jgi:hypothetical protein